MGKVDGTQGMAGEKTGQKNVRFRTLTVLLIVVGVIFVGLCVSVVITFNAAPGSQGDAERNDNGATKAPSVAGKSPQGPQISVRVTVENIVTNDDTEFRATKQLKTTRKSAYEIMRDLEKIDSRFRFTTKENKDFGHYVTHVQGVKSDWNEKTYWAFLRRTDKGDCSVSMGVSSYIPSDGEHLVLSLVKSPNNLKYCTSLDKSTTTPGQKTTNSRTTQTPELYRTTASEPQISVRVTVENIVTNDDTEFRATKQLKTTTKSAYKIMRDLEKIDSRFRFTTKEHKTFGHYVTHVQGVKSDWNEKTYWAFLRRTDKGDCLIPLGVSSYIPSDGEHLVLSLVKSPNNLKSCLSLSKSTTIPDSTTTEIPTTQTPSTPSGPRMTVVFTFENLVTNDKREFRATTDFNTTRKTAYEIMRDIEKTDPTFRFTTKEHKTFGHYVTHVQGVKSDWNEKTYWAFLRRTDKGDCLVPLGVSSYIPSDGEHLVLSLVKSPNNLKSCTSLDKSSTTLEPTTVV